MVEIIDIPLVKPLAEWAWGPEEAPICLSELPLLGMACFSQFLAKAFGIVIIVASMLNKIPIMKNMMSSQSAAGISRNALYGEAMVYANCAIYGLLSGHPFTAYGENISLLGQNIVLVLLAWHYVSKTSSRVQSTEKILVVGFFVTYILGAIHMLPEDYWSLLMSSTWPILLYARGSQVLETFREKHTGNLSIVTTSMALFGGTIRILTTLQETGDMVVIAGYLLGVSLSLLMFIQYWMYLAKTKEVLEQASLKKEE